MSASPLGDVALGVDDPSIGVACEKDAENGSNDGRLAVETGGLGESTITDESTPDVHSAPAVVLLPPIFSSSTLSKDSAPGRPEGEPRIVLLLDDDDEVELSAELECEGGAR